MDGGWVRKVGVDVHCNRDGGGNVPYTRTSGPKDCLQFSKCDKRASLKQRTRVSVELLQEMTYDNTVLQI